MSKKLLFTLFTTIVLTQSVFAMDPQLEEARARMRQRWQQENNAPEAEAQLIQPAPIANNELPIEIAPIEEVPEVHKEDEVTDADYRDATQKMLDQPWEQEGYLCVKQVYMSHQLFEAAIVGNLAKVERLLAAGADETTKNENADTPFTMAIRNNHIAICELFLERGADVNYRQKQNNQGFYGTQDTPLMIAAVHGHESICRLLIAHGADINAHNAKGETALILAALAGETRLCELFLEHGANPNIQAYDGNTAFLNLLTKLTSANLAIGEVFLDYGADIRPKDKYDLSVLMIPNIAHPNIEYTKKLISRAIFAPFKNKQQLSKSCKNTLHTLCVLRRACPALPRDIRYKILNSAQRLQNDAWCTPFGMHKGQLQRVCYLPLQVVQSLVHGNLINSDQTVEVLYAHNCEQLKPLMVEACEIIDTDEIRELLNPNELENRYGIGIKNNIRKRLGLPISDEMLALERAEEDQEELAEQRRNYENVD